MKRVTRPRGRGEQGSILVLWAVLLVGVLTMVAIVIDLAALRQDRRASRLAADAAATAGALALETGGPVGACDAAWGYAMDNLRISAASPCSASFNATCTAGPEVNTIVGDYRIRIKTPVPNNDPYFMKADSIGGDLTQSSNTAVDGSDPCQRVGVGIQLNREPFFAQVAGFGAHRTDVHSVGLRLSNESGIPLSLVILEPTRCPALSSNGSGGIEVTGTSPTLVGGILVVSSGSSGCSPPTPRTLEVGGNSHITVTTPGHIYLAAMTGPTCTGAACTDTQYDNSVPYDRGFNPYPAKPIKVPDRGLVDAVYNCRANYNSTGPDPNYRVVHQRGTSGTILPACTGTMVTTPESDFVNHLFRAVTTGALEPTGVVTDYACGSLPPTITGNARINGGCPNITLTVNGNVWFTDPSTLTPTSLTVNGNAVFSGGVTLGTGNALTINGNAEFRGGSISVSGPSATGGSLTVRGSGTICSNADFVADATACVRRSASTAGFVFLGPAVGVFGLNGGNVNLDRVTVFGSGGATSTATTGPTISLGGNGNIRWEAPQSGPFTNLLGWSDKVSQLTGAGSGATWHTLTGGGVIDLHGVFFSPLARVNVTGTGNISPQRAQFWTGALTQDGAGRFQMTPDGSFINVPVGSGTRLIR